MRKTWVIVASSSVARAYQLEPGRQLVEKACLKHPESKLLDHELVSDRPGRTISGAGGTYPMGYTTDPHAKEKLHFADELAEWLQKEVPKEGVERLHLMANPTFLGMLRPKLSPQVVKCIGAEIAKDLTHLTPKELIAYLPEFA